MDRVNEEPLSALIVGAGPGGIATAVMLKDRGIDKIRLLERADRIGGTWYNNRYPGLACDVCGDHYSISFFDTHEWTRAYPRPEEFRGYLERTVDHFGIGDKITLGVAVETAVWNDSDGLWEVLDSAGGLHRAKALVGAVGMFNERVFPDISGLDQFGGDVVHTGDWPMDGGSDLLTGKSVAVIGSAASAIQFIPAAAPSARHLFVFQRTANWVFPKDDVIFDEATRLERASDPAIGRANRAASVDLVNTLGDFNNDDLMSGLRQAAMENLAQVDDEHLRALLTPKLPIGAQRPLLSSEYYPTFNRANVTLITTGIDAIETEGIRSQGELFAVDTIVLATGYAAHKFFSVIDVRGRDGLSLREHWQEGAFAYLGMTVDHFPNMFMLYGPNSNGGSIIDKLETQATYITNKIEHILRNGIESLEVRSDVVADYNEGLQRELTKMAAWQIEGSKYYRAPSGRVVTQCPYTPTEYDSMARADDLDAFVERVRTT